MARADKDFEFFIKFGGQFPIVFFDAIDEAKEYAKSGIEVAKSIVESKRKMIGRSRAFSLSWLKDETAKIHYESSYRIIEEMQNALDIINDAEFAERNPTIHPHIHPLKHRLTTVMARAAGEERRTIALKSRIKVDIFFFAFLRAMLFFSLTGLLFVIPLLSDIDDAITPKTTAAKYKQVLYRILPIIFALFWEIIGEFVKPFQIEMREDEATAIWVGRSAMALRITLDRLSSYLD